ncbi:hypothetical protein [Endozoicomonas sp. ONNA2]|uniref:hypothetical protein n=1 Tax=Endozoicomonas sp. ONNA2 TaxID=2828741 RepID=UPI002147E42D|nr:hypothetical protein [Endozoicomonas sp. ONNA2]
MNPANAIVDRFVDFSDYQNSSAFKKNPQANVFTPLRKVTSEPAKDNCLPLPIELKMKITSFLNLKDFAAFSSINVDNYLSLRSDDLLVKRVIKNEVEARMLEKLKDLQQKEQQYTYDINAPVKIDKYNNAVIPPLAISPGPSQLIFTHDPEFYNPQSFHLVRLFDNLCMLATDDTTDIPFRMHTCSLAIDINNKMSAKGSEYATLNALNFISIALQLNQLTGIEDKVSKVCMLADMIENKEFHRGSLNKAAVFKEVLSLSKKNQFDWDKFIDSLRTKANPPVDDIEDDSDIEDGRDFEYNSDFVDDDDLLDN